jgi:hypothetical protein
VALVQHLPERNLGVARDIDILRTIRDELHESTSHLCLCSISTLFFSPGATRRKRKKRPRPRDR